MDLEVVAKLRDAGLDPSGSKILHVPAETDASGRVVPIGVRVPVVDDTESVVIVELQPVASLFVGSAMPPDLDARYPEGYIPLFATVEVTAVACCSAQASWARDDEFERLYGRLRRNPDGADPDPLFSYLRAAVRLHMSLHDTSRAEFDAVLRRLARAARQCRTSVTSRRYIETIAGVMNGEEDAASAPLLRYVESPTSAHPLGGHGTSG